MADISNIILNGTSYSIKDSVTRAAIGGPNVAATKAAMTDTSKIYVYVGSESGMVKGNWYYRNGSVWTSGGVYQSTGLITDTTLSTSGVAADAKATGDETVGIRNILVSMQRVQPDYAEYGSISTDGGIPIDVENRIRSGFIKPNTVPFTITATSGYTFNLYTYDLNLNFKTRVPQQTTYTISSSERYLRLVVIPSQGTVDLSDFPNAFTNDFSDCVVFGTLNDSEKIKHILYNTKIRHDYYATVQPDYAEYGSISSDGTPIDIENRIRSGFIKPNTVPFTITATSGYKFNLYSYDLDLNFKTRITQQTTYTITSSERYLRLVVIPDEGLVDSSDFPNAFTNDFSDCVVFGTLNDMQYIRKTLDAQNKFPEFSMNVNLTGLSSMVWEYQNWVFPQVVSYKKIRDCVYFGFTNKAGYTGVACYNRETRDVTKTFLKHNTVADDHNLTAVMMMSTGRLICAYSGGHNVDKYIFVRTAKAYESIEAFNDPVVLESKYLTSYSQLFEYNNKIYLFYRTNNLSWSYRISEDYGETWSSEVRLILAPHQYYCQFTETTTPGVLRLCSYSNPDQNDSNIRMGFLHLDTMAVYDTDNATLIGTTDVASTDLTIVVPVTSGKVNRLFNAAKTAIADTKILYCVFSLNQTSDGEYYVYNNGVNTKIADAGYALWVPKAQLGAAWIGNTQIAIARGYLTRDLIEIYNFTNNTASLNRTVADNDRGQYGIRTARPMIDDHQRVMVYFKGYFNPNSYYDFTTDGQIYDLSN